MIRIRESQKLKNSNRYYSGSINKRSWKRRVIIMTTREATRKIQQDIAKIKALYQFGVDRDLSVSWFDASCRIQREHERWNTPEYRFIEESLWEINGLVNDGVIIEGYARRINGALLAIFFSPNCSAICRKFGK
jgi:hypothetical protein